MPTLLEIGPFNASQGQHRRKDATEQIKNLTLAGSRTQVSVFSSADAITTKPRVPVFDSQRVSDFLFVPLRPFFFFSLTTLCYIYIYI